jgi:hypothetical protein
MFLQERFRELDQLGLAARGQLHDHAPPVGRVPPPPDQPEPDHPVHEADGAVMADEKLRSQEADGRLTGSGGANGQKKLVLLRLKTDASRRAGAEVEEAADVVPELGELAPK